MSVVIDRTAYEFSHGRKPRGHGWWVFELQHFGSRAAQRRKFWLYGTYSRCVRSATKTAREKGYDAVVVLP